MSKNLYLGHRSALSDSVPAIGITDSWLTPAWLEHCAPQPVTGISN